MLRADSPPPDRIGELGRWQRRVFASAWITYFAYYLCRLNMPMAKTRLCDTFSWNADDIGIVFSSLTLMYAVGQFVNGQLADRYGARAIVGLGVLGSVAMNLAVFAVVLAAGDRAASPRAVLAWVAILWGANGFFQAMGWPPIVRLMTHWFPAGNRGSVMGVLGTCYQLGGAFAWFLAFFLTGYYVQRWHGDWRVVFLVPALFFAVVGTVCFLLMRNRPEDVGLAALDADDERTSDRAGSALRTDAGGRASLPGQACTPGGRDARPPISFRPHSGPYAMGHPTTGTLIGNVITTLRNPYLWVVAWTFFLLDVNRYGFMNWLPAYLDARGAEQGSTLMAHFAEVMKRCIHPLAGSAGAVIAGWATDRFFDARRAPVIAILLVLLGVFSILFPYIDPERAWLVFIVVALIGFCTYGPHILMVGHAAQDFGRKHGAAGAAGFIDAMGYVGASFAGWGAGVLIRTRGYGFAFWALGFAAILGALLIMLIWRAGPETRRPAIASNDAGGRVHSPEE